MKTYIARTYAEAAGLHDGRITLLVILCNPQPDGAARFSGCDKPEPYILRKGSPVYYDPLKYAPYAPGDVIGVKEWWLPLGFTDCDVYRADCAAGTLEQYRRGGYKWRRCPNANIRTRPLCESVEARQVQSIDYDEIVAFGIKQKWTCISPSLGTYCHDNDITDDFRVEWGRRYPKFPWASNPWAFFTTVKLETGK